MVQLRMGTQVSYKASRNGQKLGERFILVTQLRNAYRYSLFKKHRPGGVKNMLQIPYRVEIAIPFGMYDK